MKQDTDLDILVEELKKRPEVLGIAVFGSFARGEDRSNSDIDVLVVTKKGVKRDIEKRGKRTFEFVYVSFSEAIKFYKANPNDCVQLWRDAVVLYDETGYMKRLHAFSKRLEKKGKAPLSDAGLKHALFDVEDAISAMESITKHDSATANLYAHIKAANLVELYFDVRQLWTPPPKKQLQKIREISKADAKVFDAFFEAVDAQKRITLLKKMVQVVFAV